VSNKSTTLRCSRPVEWSGVPYRLSCLLGQPLSLMGRRVAALLHCQRINIVVVRPHWKTEVRTAQSLVANLMT
jgi:hypothetical protein